MAQGSRTVKVLCILEEKNEEVWNYERWSTKTVTSIRPLQARITPY